MSSASSLVKRALHHAKSGATMNRRFVQGDSLALVERYAGLFASVRYPPAELNCYVLYLVKHISFSWKHIVQLVIATKTCAPPTHLGLVVTANLPKSITLLST